MMRRILDAESPLLESSLNGSKFINPYFLVNIEAYGIFSSNVSAWCCEDSAGEWSFLLYLYYGTAQLVPLREAMDSEIRELVHFVRQKNLKMLSGPVDLIEHLSRNMGDEARVVSGVLMEDVIPIRETHGGVRRAGVGDLREIAELICGDHNVGRHYEVEQLEKQLLDRQTRRNCRNYVVDDAEGIACHVATYAESADIAVIGGVVTRANARGRGYASSALNELSAELACEGVKTYLYCYGNKLEAWYKVRGWRTVLECAKLERSC